MALKKIISVVFVAWITYLILALFEKDEIDRDMLKGKNIVVTGASSGIGEQMAYWYARYGANVFITARRESLLQKVVSQCKSLGEPSAKFTYMVADMANESDRDLLIENALEFFGDIDQLILNHAYMPPIHVWDGAKDKIDHLKTMMNVNVVASVHLTGLALKSLERTQGSVSVVGSIQGRVPTPYTVEYCSSKFALDGFFSGLRHEFKANNKNVSITYGIIGVVGTDKAAEVQKKYFGLLDTPSEFVLMLFAPSKPEDAAHAIISATTRRQGEVYFPKYQMLWFQAIVRSFAPEFFESFDFGFTLKDKV